MENLLVKNRQLDNKELLYLQKSFRKGSIEEKDIPERQLQRLKKLYHEQIDFLEKSIEADRQKILKIKKQL